MSQDHPVNRFRKSMRKSDRKEGESSRLDDHSDLENQEGCWKNNALGLGMVSRRKILKSKPEMPCVCSRR